MTAVMYCEDQTCACNHFGFCEYKFGIALDKDRKCKAYIENKNCEVTEEYSLKPCPFCGSKAFINTDFHFVACSQNKSGGMCPVRPKTWDFSTDEKAIEAWNSRCESV